MSRALVLFASHYGQTQRIAERIGRRLRARGHEVDVVDVAWGPRRLPHPEDYDVVAIGSRVESGRHAREVRSYVSKHLESLREVPSAFFSVSMAATRPGAGPDPDGYMRTMFAALGWRPPLSVALAGGLPYRKYGWLLRFIMKRISQSAGGPTDTSRDHELTDWARVDQFADDLAAKLPEEQQASSS